MSDAKSVKEPVAPVPEAVSASDQAVMSHDITMVGSSKSDGQAGSQEGDIIRAETYPDEKQEKLGHQVSVMQQETHQAQGEEGLIFDDGDNAEELQETEQIHEVHKKYENNNHDQQLGVYEKHNENDKQDKEQKQTEKNEEEITEEHLEPETKRDEEKQMKKHELHEPESGGQQEEEKHEQPDEQPRDQRDEQKSEQSYDQRDEQQGEPPHDQPHEQQGEQSHDQPHEQQGEQPHDQPHEQQSEPPHDQPHEQQGERPRDQLHEQQGEQSHDHRDEQQGEQPHDQRDEQQGEQPHDQPHEQQGEQPHDQMHEQQGEQRSGSSDLDEEESSDSSSMGSQPEPWDLPLPTRARLRQQQQQAAGAPGPQPPPGVEPLALDGASSSGEESDDEGEDAEPPREAADGDPLGAVLSELLELDARDLWLEVYRRSRNEAGEASLWADTAAARRPECRQRNRYRDVLPYDHSRVRLRTAGQPGDCDYINASLVTATHAGRAYIMTQGPLPSTCGHFWQMVWQQGSPGVVMLTRLVEKSTVKCHQYYPDGRHPVLEFPEEALTVEHLSTESRDWYLVSRLRLTCHGDHPDSRQVLLFRYLSWPDFGVPEDPRQFLSFLMAARRAGLLRDPGRPPVVHCSAGIGRTGAFALVDVALACLARRPESALSLGRELRQLRRHRLGLVQTPEQLRFCYVAVAAAGRAVLKAGAEAAESGEIELATSPEAGDADELEEAENSRVALEDINDASDSSSESVSSTDEEGGGRVLTDSELAALLGEGAEEEEAPEAPTEPAPRVAATASATPATPQGGGGDDGTVGWVPVSMATVASAACAAAILAGLLAWAVARYHG